jgi:glycosyltransferase involved in cell wall biosynthesis
VSYVISDDNPRRSVSIIIPAYNAERFLARTLASALAQDYEPFDIIVVNDGSTDNTAKIVSEFSAKDQRVRLISTANNGVAAARNTGLSASTAEFVAFLDADDLWFPGKIRLQVEALEAKDEYAAAYTWCLLIDEDDKVLRQNPSWQLDGYTLCRYLITWPVGNGSALLVKRKVALAIGGFDPEFNKLGCQGAEDLDFELRLVEKYKVTCAPRFLVGYRHYPGNMSSDGRRMIKSVIRAVSRALERNRRVPPICARWARASMYSYAAATSRRPAEILYYLSLIVSNDRRLGLRAARALGRRLTDWFWHRLNGPEPPTQTSASFYEWDSPQSFRPDRVTQRRVEKLKHIDWMLERECGRSWADVARSRQRVGSAP